MRRIAIVGGGISGLAVAYELARRGDTGFTLYEASPRLGGIVETVREDGFVVECGPDSWVTEKPWARELAVELGLESEIIPSEDGHRRTYLLQGSQLTPMPDGMRMMVPTDLEAIERSTLFSESAKAAYRAEPARAGELKAFAAARSPHEDESVASFVERHFGGEVTTKIAGPLLAGVFGGDIRQLSATAVMAPFLKMEREHGSLILGLRQRSSGSTGPVFTTLKSGLQSLIEGMTARMAAVLTPANIHLREPVLSLRRTPAEWQVRTPAGTFPFDRIVVAAPVHVARQLLSPLHGEFGSLLDIEATSSVVAALAFDRERSLQAHVPEGFGFLVPRRVEGDAGAANPELLATTFVDQKFAHRAPDGCLLLRAFYGGDSAPALLSWSDDAIVQLTLGHLSRVLGDLPQARITVVRRWPLSLPQYTVGHPARVARIEEIAESIPGLHLTGNAFHGVGLPDLIARGRDLAARLS
jgi:oxygen-dependent protoporphyrinogen oxidase